MKADWSLAKKIVSFYPPGDWINKLKFWQRWCCTPYLTVEKFIPRQGRILDLGCGWGWFSQLLSLTASQRRVFGFDISFRRLKGAHGLFAGRGFPFFGLGTLSAVKENCLQAIVIYDMLHHLSYEQQEDCLYRAWHCLSNGGTVVIKENGTRPRWKYVVNYFIEIVALKTGYTLSEPLSFRRDEEWRYLLENKGFKVSMLRLNTWHPWPHLLIVGRK